MKLVFLKSAASDLSWMRRYYRSVFPQGSLRAKRQYTKTIALIKTNPHIGEPIEEFIDAHEYPILSTPFSMIYRIREDRIEVLRIIDNRSDWMMKG